MGLRRTVLPYNWIVVMAVVPAAFAVARLFTDLLVGKLVRRLMPDRGAVAPPPHESWSTGPGRTRQSILSSFASRSQLRVRRTSLEARASKNGAPSPARFADQPTFKHPTFDSKHETLSIIPIGPGLAPWFQTPFGRPVRPAPGGTPILRRRPQVRPDTLAKDRRVFHRREEVRPRAAKQRPCPPAFA